MQRLKASGGSAGEGGREAPGGQREERQFLVFRLGDDEFGLPIEAVDEVARVPDQITRLPRTPKFLEGVVNLRGEVLPVVDQRRRFDMPALDERAAAPPGRRQDRAPQGGPDRRFGVRGAALPGRRDRAGAQPQQRDRQAGPRRGQPRAGGPHRPAARSRRAADARRARPARHVPGQGGACRLVTKVLVVDDSALMRKLLGRIFSKEADFEVQFARNGLEALELLAAFRPDVVTLDIHMPQMDGLACLDRIMVEHPCPVVMVSSLTAEGAEATLEALRLGAVDFVAKPEGAISLHIDELTDELIAKVRAAATARIGRAPASRSASGTASAGTRRRSTGSGPPRTRSTRQPGAAACRRRRPGAGRHLDRRTAGAGSAADGPARRLSAGRSSSPSTCRRPSRAPSPGG